MGKDNAYWTREMTVVKTYRRAAPTTSAGVGEPRPHFGLSHPGKQGAPPHTVGEEGHSQGMVPQPSCKLGEKR